MALAAVGWNPPSRTRRISSRISPLTSLTSLSAFAVAALDAFLRRLEACSGARGTSRALASRVRAACSAHHSPLLRGIGSSATYLFIEGEGTVRALWGG